jgi:hypothetical protein
MVAVDLAVMDLPKSHAQPLSHRIQGFHNIAMAEQHALILV